MTFENLKLIEPILHAVKAEGYTEPTPIQVQAIPVLLNGKDLMGCAQTGTGKTAAFAIPILQLLYGKQLPSVGKRQIKALIITPTRELAIQINESFAAYGKYTGLRHTVIYGGVSQYAQTTALKNGVDILVATPGRLLDLIDQRFVTLQNIQFFVLDEADRMLDMGFIHDVKKIIVKLPAKRQSLFFSATMPPDAQKLAATILVNPVKVEVKPIVATTNLIKQAIYFVDKPDKKSLLIHLLQDKSIETALVFTRTKHGADKISRDLTKAGIKASAIHGNKSQVARQDALNNFKNKRTRVLVATDIAARGIDVDQLSHVINFELPNVPETYIHRIGRTGRAGLDGVALSFCDAEERDFLRDIHKLIAKTIPVIEDHPFPMKNPIYTGPALQSRPFNNHRPPKAEFVASSRYRPSRVTRNA
ncbi:MAG: DEAD/DEAH box helicase [Bacteroidetes bacterium]|nr:DEAD/DEAH box helicase [Bacteroidota bacterium]